MPFLVFSAGTLGLNSSAKVPPQNGSKKDFEVGRNSGPRRHRSVATENRLPTVEFSSAAEVARTERRVLEKSLANADIDDPASWLTDAFTEVLDVLDGAGKPARAITKLVPRLATKIVLGGGKYTQTAGATSRVLGLMAVEGLCSRSTGRQLDRTSVRMATTRPMACLAREATNRTRGSNRTGPLLPRPVRAGHRNRPQMVDRLDSHQNQEGALRAAR